MLALVRSWPTSPAAWNVEPDVSLWRSTSTVSVQPKLGEVVGRRAADDAAADDHGPSRGWLVRHVPCPSGIAPGYD